MDLAGWFRNARKRYKIGREKPQLWFFEEAGFGYIQIPKVATRSIRQAFANTRELGYDGADFSAFEQRHSAHLSAHEIRARVGDAPVFAFVRHPLARLHSAWVNKIVDAERKGERNILACHGIHFGTSFEDFVDRVCDLPDRRIDRHLRAQVWFLHDEQGLIPTFVGKMECFPDDWQRLRETIPVLGEVGHANKAAFGADYVSHYTPRMIDKVVQRYEADFRLFGYEPERAAA